MILSPRVSWLLGTWEIWLNNSDIFDSMSIIANISNLKKSENQDNFTCDTNILMLLFINLFIFILIVIHLQKSA